MEKKEETDNQKRKRLINKAIDMECEIQHLECQIATTLDQIKELNPTKKELKNGLQDLMDYYYWE